MPLSFEEHNFDALLRIPENITAVGNAAFREAVDDVQARARESVAGTPGRSGLYSRTGALYRSIKKGPYFQWRPGGVGKQKVFSNHPGARVQELGATIRAVHKPFLVFRIWEPWDVTEPTGPWVRVRQVTVPPRPFLGPAATWATKLWDDYMSRALRNLKRTMGWEK